MSKNIFATLGATNHSEGERAEQDYYATDPKAIDLLINEGGRYLIKIY